MNKTIYLDNGATTRPYNEIFDYININKNMLYGNPSSLHKLGMEAEREMKKVRNILADIFEARTDELVFTSGGTEANNLAINGYLKRNKHNGNRIITTKMEHPSVKNVFESLQNTGYEVKFISNDNYGTLDLEELANLINDNTALVSIMHVNNETGNINDIEKIGNIIKAKNDKTIFHVDGVQGFLKVDLNFQKSKIDMYSISGHKIHAFKGIGVLYKQKNVNIEPLLYGGGQENNIRSGTENLLGIVSLGIAILKFSENKKNISEMISLKNKLKEGLLNIENVNIISSDLSSPFILSASFPNIPSETLIHFLENEKIYASPGAACSSRKKEKRTDSTIRFSFCYNNTIDEISYVIEILK